MKIYFQDLAIESDSEVYAPAEDSFLLANALEIRSGDSVLDIGTGSGIIALTAAKKASNVLGVDLNPRAVKLAERNAVLNGLGNVVFKESDLFSSVSGRFDVIAFNPPYLPVSEDGLLERSWSGGVVGIDILLRFISQVRGFLREDGRVYMVASSLNPLDEIRDALSQSGLSFSIVAEEKIGRASCRERV